ncbi:IS4 family transposase [Photobacterium sp. BZF1]|uniref:IS4 family transposase n=1 Tax=Photobacterium sp. BZF1 TaxID=1904457 RepID=UPI001653ACBC|nr:IS4 family transposase [Photobacterium sp. BZF1]MBC7006811.1 IS4 family transposase [Photobacterium sp. BZF1]
MLVNELNQAHETIDNGSNYESVVNAIEMEWIEQALHSTNKASIRRRRLPAQQAVWLVIWMGLQRNKSIKEVCSSLDLALQPQPENSWSRVAPSVLTDSRRRLDEAPLAALFKTAVSAWEADALQPNNALNLNVLAVDGTTFRCPDSEENAEAFGFISKTYKPYPQLRLVGLMAAETRMMLGAAFDACNVGEATLARCLLTDVPANSLTLFDRCYFSADLLLSWQEAAVNSHWLTPVKRKLRYEVIEQYAGNDMLIAMPISQQARKKNPELPATWQARLVLYKDPAGEIEGFITSLIDPNQYQLEELLSIYWQRWEIEEGFGEIKQTQLQSEVTLRSRFPSGVKQEIWGVLLAYNLVRLEMVQIAADANVKPTRVSFTAAINLIDTQLRWLALSPDGTLPTKLKQMRESLSHFILPDKRKDRTFPRSVLYVPPKYPFRYKR